jgi:LmbE family N-acetylglucosaminyl deacetylase
MNRILLALALLVTSALHAANADGKLRIVVFGGHPDDAEYKAGGTAAKWARLGHHVKLVSATNGDLSDRPGTREEIAARRAAEVAACAGKLGVTAEVLEIHDGGLVPDLTTRKTFVRVIREWRADIVIGHRLSDYHPDHRAVAQLLQDSSFLVTARRFCPEIPALERMPVYLFASDDFKTPRPFRADLAVALDDVFEQKLDGLHEIASQVYEGRTPVRGVPPANDEAARRTWLKKRWSARQRAEADKHRDVLVNLYGEKAGRAVQLARPLRSANTAASPRPRNCGTCFPSLG